jgi:purine-binding chemotaxis protein CheW
MPAESRPDPISPMSNSDSYILFELAGATYGIRSGHVQHIDMLEQVTPVPNTIAAVAGVVFSRGQVVPAVDLRVRFGLPPAAPTVRTRLVFIRVDDRLVALIVDAAREFRVIPPEAIRPIEETLHGIEGNYVEGVATVGPRLVLLLDLPAVLRLDEIPAPAAEPALPAS